MLLFTLILPIKNLCSACDIPFTNSRILYGCGKFQWALNLVNYRIGCYLSDIKNRKVKFTQGFILQSPNPTGMHVVDCNHMPNHGSVITRLARVWRQLVICDWWGAGVRIAEWNFFTVFNFVVGALTRENSKVKSSVKIQRIRYYIDSICNSVLLDPRFPLAFLPI